MDATPNADRHPGGERTAALPGASDRLLRWRRDGQICYFGRDRGAHMNERRGDEQMDRDPRHHDDRRARGGPDDGRDSDQGGGGRDGGDTRFLQLEMSRVLYAEAEDVAKPAFRALLLEAAKAHLGARFGDEITRLAQLAVDELLADVEASLDVEEKIQRRRESSGGANDQVRVALGRKRSERSQPAAERGERRAAAARRRRR
jgi:hypothetical protein